MNLLTENCLEFTINVIEVLFSAEILTLLDVLDVLEMTGWCAFCICSVSRRIYHYHSACCLGNTLLRLQSVRI